MKQTVIDEQRRSLILSGGLFRSIIVLGAPNMLMGLVQAITPFVDSLFIYNAAGDTAGAAVTFAGPVLNFVQAFGIGLGSAGLAIIGRANGAGNREQTRMLSIRFLKTVSAVGIVAGILLVIFASYAVSPLSPSLSPSAAHYLRLTSICIPFMYFASAYNAIALGRGLAEKTLYRSLINLVLKITGDYIFILMLHKGVTGAAQATLLASIASTLFMAYDLRSWFRNEHKRAINHSEIKPVQPQMPQSAFVLILFKLGIPSALVQASTSLSFYFMNNEAARYGTAVLNGFGIANTINSIFFAPAAAIGTAIAASSAITCGAKAFSRARHLSSAGLWMAAISSLVFTAILFPAAKPMVSIFSKTPEVVSFATEAMQYFSISIIGFAIFNVIAGAFSGIGKTAVPLWIAIIRIWILRVPVVLVLGYFLPDLQEKIVWISMAVSNFGTAAVALIMFRHIPWSHSSLRIFDFDGTKEEAP